MIDDNDNNNNNDNDAQERAHVKIPVEEPFEARYVTRLVFDSSRDKRVFEAARDEQTGTSAMAGKSVLIRRGRFHG